MPLGGKKLTCPYDTMLVCHYDSDLWQAKFQFNIILCSHYDVVQQNPQKTRCQQDSIAIAQ